MDRRPITADVVRGVDRLLDNGLDSPAIAARLAVTPYLVRVIANDRVGRGRVPPESSGAPKPFDNSRSTDAATIRMIQRMLRMGVLSQQEIAHEAGVSLNIVEQVVAGRLPLSNERPILFKDFGERFLRRPIRCKHCGAMISIAPCRACRALRS